MFYKALTHLVKSNIVRKPDAKRGKYSVIPEAHNAHKTLFEAAETSIWLRSPEPISVIMNALAESTLFKTREKAVLAAVEYWRIRYQSFSVLSATYALLIENSEDLTTVRN
jgi:hypothetical protein